MKGFCYWLANVISGGELSHLEKLCAIKEGTIEALKGSADDAALAESLAWDTARNFGDRLNLIAALETPKANATVRKMAKIARGETSANSSPDPRR